MMLATRSPSIRLTSQPVLMASSSSGSLQSQYQQYPSPVLQIALKASRTSMGPPKIETGCLAPEAARHQLTWVRIEKLFKGCQCSTTPRLTLGLPCRFAQCQGNCGETEAARFLILQPLSHFGYFDGELVMVSKIMHQEPFGLQLVETFQISGCDLGVPVIDEVVRAGGNPALSC